MTALWTLRLRLHTIDIETGVGYSEGQGYADYDVVGSDVFSS